MNDIGHPSVNKVHMVLLVQAATDFKVFMNQESLSISRVFDISL